MTEVLSKREAIRFASIVEYMKEHDRLTNKIGRKLIGISESSVKHYLNRLCEVGILMSEGSTSDTEYFR
jgi:predicted HTH transcriptional regulator